MEGGIVIGLYRYVRVEFWKDAKVCECMNPREKLLFVYLLTNPYTTQIGIYKITIKQIAFDLDFTKPYVKKSLEKFEHEYNIIRYNSKTNEIAIRNWGKYNLTRLGKPMEMCIEKELKGVSDISLVNYVISSIESSRAYEIYSRFLEGKSIENTRNYTYVTLGSRGEKEKQKENKKEKENTKVINLGGRDHGKSSREFKPKIKEFDERPSEDMLKFAREL